MVNVKFGINVYSTLLKKFKNAKLWLSCMTLSKISILSVSDCLSCHCMLWIHFKSIKWWNPGSQGSPSPPRCRWSGSSSGTSGTWTTTGDWTEPRQATGCCHLPRTSCWRPIIYCIKSDRDKDWRLSKAEIWGNWNVCGQLGHQLQRPDTAPWPALNPQGSIDLSPQPPQGLTSTGSTCQAPYLPTAYPAS